MSSNKTAEEKLQEMTSKIDFTGPLERVGFCNGYLAGHAEGLGDKIDLLLTAKCQFDKVKCKWRDAEKQLASQETLIAELRSQLEACHRDGIKYAGMEKENFELRKDLAWATDYAERTGLFSTRGKAKAIRVKHFGEGKG